jgi:hypothetical protein
VDIETQAAPDNSWTLFRYSDRNNGIVFRRLNETCTDYEEIIVSETPYGWVCIDQANNYIDVVYDMKEAFIWIHER